MAPDGMEFSPKLLPCVQYNSEGHGDGGGGGGGDPHFTHSWPQVWQHHPSQLHNDGKCVDYTVSTQTEAHCYPSQIVSSSMCKPRDELGSTSSQDPDSLALEAI